jgi:diguanylate cyclase (GGDEF)-like protein/PAS domain S-box-containing protein
VRLGDRTGAGSAARADRPDPLAGPSVDDLRRVIEAQRALATAAPDPTVVMPMLCEVAWSLLGAEGTIVSVPVGDRIVARAVAGVCGVAPGDEIPRTGTLAGLTIDSRTPQLSRDGEADPRTLSSVNRSYRTRSSALVPLVDEGEVIAVLGAVSSEPAAFDQADLDLLAMLADVGAHRLGHALSRQEGEQLRSQSRTVLSAMSEGLLLVDTEGTILFANEAASHLLELPSHQIRGRQASDAGWAHVHEDTTPWPGDDFPTMRVIATGRAHRNQVMGLRTRDGGLRWLLVNAVPMADADGRLTGVVSSFADITSRREAELALQESERRLSASQELAGLASWEMDVITGAIRWSPHMYRSLGLDPETFHVDGESHRALVHPEDYPALVALGDEVLRTGKPGQMASRMRHADGTWRDLWNWCDATTGADGATMLWGTTQDVTERESALRALAASEEHFRVAFDNAPIGMSVISVAAGSAGTFLRVNESFAAMLGHEPADFPSLGMASLTHPDDRARDGALFRRFVEGGATEASFEKRFRHKDGHTVFAWLTCAVVNDADGAPQYLISHALDITERRREQAELERLALTDTLTGLANRTLLNDRLDQALARIHRTGGIAALLLLDIDGFKFVNDSLGHQTGDALLVAVAERIEAVSRADATVARLGGDEFVVLVEGLTDDTEVHPVVARLLEAMRRPHDLGPGAESVVATVSIGVSVATTAERAPEDLYREADLALYRAKDGGRDQYALFDDALRARADGRMSAERLLRTAFADDLVVPLFQPVIDLADGAVVGAEALARIRSGEQLITPDAFVDVAEETGLVVELDARMFECAVRQMARWRADGLTAVRCVSTNVSARSLEDPAFTDRLRKILTWYGVPGSAVQIELTERSLLSSSQTLRESMERLSDIGIAVGLDDFGTGYSALAYLQRFDLSFMKIDRSFVSRLGDRDRDDALVAAVVGLAHAHELTVVAEGIETAEQLAALRSMGCDRAQGYLVGRPMPAQEIDSLVHADRRW